MKSVTVEEYGFELWQGGIMVASGYGSDKDRIEGEGWHYAKIYAQDGPCHLKFTAEVRPGAPEGERGKR